MKKKFDQVLYTASTSKQKILKCSIKNKQTITEINYGFDTHVLSINLIIIGH